MTDATVLFAHGSRDPSWSQPIEAVAARMRKINATHPVRCAYLELMRPDLATAVGELVSAGADTVTIVPLFLGLGRHARQDLPVLVADLARAHPRSEIRLRPTIGEDPHFLDAIARIALG